MNKRFPSIFLTFILAVILLTGCGSTQDTIDPGVGAENITFAVMPDDGVSVVTDRIDAAKSRLYVKVYLITDEDVLNAIASAKERGVPNIKVMVEEHPYGTNNDKAVVFFKEHNIDWKYASPAFALTHEKSIVADDNALIMTSNMTYGAFNNNREFIVIQNNKGDVDEVARCFADDWDRTEFVPTQKNLVWSPVNSREKINSVINSAQKKLDIYAEEVNDTQQTGLLISRAKNGLSIRLLTTESSYGTDQLVKGGVQVRFIQKPYIHAKAFITDYDIAFTGSENISTSSLDKNRELGILIADKAAISRLSSTFESDWKNASETDKQ